MAPHHRAGFAAAIAAGLALWCLTAPSLAHARSTTPALLDGWMVDRWTVDDGLPLNHVRDMAIDTDGFVWFATFDGLARFDGTAFHVFRRREVPELPSNRLPFIQADPRGGLWVISEEGDLVRITDAGVRTWRRGEEPIQEWLQRFALFRGQPYAYGPGGVYRLDLEGPVRLVDARPRASVASLSMAPSGELWFLRVHDGLYRLQDGVEQLVVAQSNAGLLTHLPDGRLLLGDEDRVSFVGEDGQLVPIPGAGERKDARVCEVTVGSDGALLLRTVESWYRDRLDQPIGEPSRTECSLPSHSAGGQWRAERHRLLLNDVVVAESAATIYGIQQVGDALWVFTNGSGVMRVRPRLVETTPAAGSMGDGITYALLPERDGVAYAGTSEDGAWRLDPEPHRIDTGEAWKRQRILALARGAQGEVFVGTGEGACRVEGLGCVDVFEGSIWLRALHVDPAGVLWAATERGVLTDVAGTPRAFDSASGPIKHGRVFADRGDDELWIGTVEDGVFQRRGDALRQWTEADGLTSNRIRSFFLDEGDMWVGTEDGGLCRIRPEAGEVACITTDQGLHDDCLHALMLDESGRLWMSTNRGIFWVALDHLRQVADGRRTDVQSIVLDERHGMRNPEGNGGQGSVAGRDSQGRLWFATQDGIAVVDPARVPVPTVPLVHLEGAWVDGVRVPVSKSLELSAEQRQLKVGWTSAQMAWPEDVRYRFRLTPHDAAWRGPTTDREAVWLELPPGRFAVEVQASLAGNWSPTSAIQGVRRPAFTETPWYFASLLACVLSLFGAAAWWRGRAQRQRQAELEEEVRRRTAGLESTTRELQAQNVEIAKQHDEIAAQAERLTELNALRKRLVADLSHELRTPLALVAGPLQDLSDTAPSLSPSNRQRLEVVQRSVGRLQDLIGQLFDLTRLENGRLPLRVRHGDLAVLLRTVVGGFATAASSSGVTLHADIRGAQWVYFDADLIEKVIGNLLSNALKFTPSGGEVTVSLHALDERVRIEVSDTGIGVEPAAQARLFDRFFQADQGDQRRFGGAGIGLALCRELVELHGGEIGVESAAGEGSTFRVELPLGVAHIAPEDIDTSSPVKPLPELAPVDAVAAEGITVLVVEDHPDMRQYLVAHLRERFAVVEAPDAVVGLQLVREQAPSAIVSDIMMPVMDGLTFARTLKGEPDTASIPIVLVSAKATEEDRTVGLEVADAYLSKPVRMRELLETVARLTGAATENPAPGAERGEADVRLHERLLSTAAEHVGDSGFGVKELAGVLALSPRQLQRTVRRLTGMSPSDLLRRQRMDTARGLLQSGTYTTTAEVAARVGLTPSYFSRLYTNWFGHPPSQDLPSSPARSLPRPPD